MSMEGIDGILKKRNVSANTRIHSEAHALADEISTFFNERKRFAMYLGVIKRIGIAQARSIFAELKSESANVQNPRKLFMWLAKNPKK